MAQVKKTINLLTKDELEKTPLGKFLKWILTSGRYIITFIELMVIIAFLARFKFDRDLAALRRQIEEKKAVIISLAELENRVRFLQDRLLFIKRTGKEKQLISPIIDDLSQLTPADVELDDLKIKEKSLSLKGKSLSKLGLSTLLYGLKTNDRFSQINLISVTSKGKKDPTLKFELTAKLEED